MEEVRGSIPLSSTEKPRVVGPGVLSFSLVSGAASVDVGSRGHQLDQDDLIVVIDPVDDPKIAAPGRMETIQLESQRMAAPLWVVDEIGVDERQHGVDVCVGQGVE
jgi:hypothetical protein